MFSFLGKNLIGYRYVASGNQFFYGFNPVANEALPQTFISATQLEVEEALELAENAFLQYAQFPNVKRVAFLHEIARQITIHRSELIRFYMLETGLPENRANVELDRAIFQFENYAQAALNEDVSRCVQDPAIPDRLPTPKPNLKKKHVALGPVVVFGASNFPFAYGVLGGDVASALAAGCTVIVKAHPMHPHTSALGAEIIRLAAIKTEMPDGVFSHLQDQGYAVGEQLVQHEKIKAVGFTGSIAGGRALMDLAANRPVPIPVYAEMGSVNPLLVHPSALKNGNAWARKITDSVALNAGQFCTSPGFLFLEKSETTSGFINELITLFSAVEPQTMLHPGIFTRFKNRVEAHSLLLKTLVPVQFGVNTITPGLGLLEAATLLNNPASREELFGAYLTLVEVEDAEEGIACLRALGGQLTATLISEEASSLDRYVFWMQQIAGRIILNGVPTGVEVSRAQQHGGPYPSSSQNYFTAVGSDAIQRFLRPVAFQNFKDQ